MEPTFMVIRASITNKSQEMKYCKVLCLVAILSSCTNSDDTAIMNSIDTVLFMNTVQEGTWRIAKFIDSNKDETHHYAGYGFTFQENQDIMATNGSTTFMGNWSIGNDSSDDSPSDIDFNIFFNVADEHDFEELNDDWDIISQSVSKIELIDISGGNGGTDYLTFEKQ